MLRIVIKHVFYYSCTGNQIDQRVPKLAYDSSFFDASIGFSYGQLMQCLLINDKGIGKKLQYSVYYNLY